VHRTNYAAKRAFGQAFREKLAGARGQSPRIKAQNQNAKQALRAQQTSDQQGAAIIKKSSVSKSLTHAQTKSVNIAAPEINGDSSLISRPVRGDPISQYSG